MDVIGVIIAGIIIGLLGKFVAPGDKDNIPIWLTILCGIGGVLIGWYVYAAFGGGETSGVDWVRWLVAIVVAAVLAVEKAFQPSTIVHLALWVPLTLGLSLWLLPSVKGALVGLQWALRMHGFGGASDAPLPRPAAD